MIKKITSLAHEEIKELAKLDSRKERDHQQRFVVEGLRALQTFIDARYAPLHIYATEKMIPHAQKVCADTSITEITEPILNKISHTTTPSGIVGIFKIPHTPAPSTLGSGIVLANISDPGNMGTLIRTCAAMGKKSVVIIDGTDVWSPKVIQATAGILAQVTIFQWTWAELQQHKKNIPLCALVVKDGKKPEKKILEHALLVIGSEAHGIPEEWIKDCDQKITLAMPGNTESLNAAVAGSIAMYIAWA